MTISKSLREVQAVMPVSNLEISALLAVTTAWLLHENIDDSPEGFVEAMRGLHKKAMRLMKQQGINPKDNVFDVGEPE